MELLFFFLFFLFPSREYKQYHSLIHNTLEILIFHLAFTWTNSTTKVSLLHWFEKDKKWLSENIYLSLVAKMPTRNMNTRWLRSKQSVLPLCVDAVICTVSRIIKLYRYSMYSFYNIKVIFVDYCLPDIVSTNDISSIASVIWKQNQNKTDHFNYGKHLDGH